MGGQSAFGTKAGDLFTRITMIVAGFWILLCIAAILVLNRQSTSALGTGPDQPEFTQGSPVDGGTSNAPPAKAEAAPGTSTDESK